MQPYLPHKIINKKVKNTWGSKILAYNSNIFTWNIEFYSISTWSVSTPLWGNSQSKWFIKPQV